MYAPLHLVPSAASYGPSSDALILSGAMSIHAWLLSVLPPRWKESTQAAASATDLSWADELSVSAERLSRVAEDSVRP